MVLVFTSGYPRDLPERSDGVLPVAKGDFDIAYNQAVAPLRGSSPQVANLGDDLWKVDYATVNLKHSEALQFSAWLRSLDGGLRTFKAWDPRLKYPQAYKAGFGELVKAGGGAFDGSCTVTGFAETLDSVTINGLPNAFQLTIGDMVSFAWAGTRLLFQLMDSVVANGSGVAVLPIRPLLPISFAITPTVSGTFVKPWCLAIVDASSVKGPFQVGQSGPISFSANQTF